MRLPSPIATAALAAILMAAILSHAQNAPVPAQGQPPPPPPQPGSMQSPTPEQQQGLPTVGPMTPEQARTAAEKVDSSLPDLPAPPPISGPQVPPPAAISPALTRAQQDTTQPSRNAPTGLKPDFLGFLGPFRRPFVPPLFPGNAERLNALIRDGKLFLSLHDALALVIENNLDVEVQRYNLQLAQTDIVRAAGGGSTRGIDYNLTESPAGVGGPGSPLLASSQTSTNPVAPTVVDLTALNSTSTAPSNLSTTGTQLYSPGPNLPYFDPSLIGEAGYLQRSDIVTIGGATGTADTGNTAEPTGTLHYVSTNIAYLEGFSPGTQLSATVNNDSQVIYGSTSQYNPFSTPSTSVTVTQPLLRGFGRAVNLRYLRIANLDRKVSHLLFEQQLIDTIYGTSRLYYDLVSLGENVSVKQEALRAAQKLYSDDRDQVELGTLAPIELTRAQALLSSSQFDLIQAQGLYRQEEVILRNQLIRPGAPAFSVAFTGIVPTDRITVPETLEPLDVPSLEAQALANRADLAQAQLQTQAGQISVQGSRNNALAQLNVYGNVETRGSSEQAYEPLGSSAAAGNGAISIPQNLALGGLRTATIYQAGVQLTLPLRNRIAEADAARDQIQLRQSTARTERLADQVREDTENAVIALQTAQSAYDAAVASRGYQQQLLDAERDKLAMGQSTNLLVVQDEAFLAQARSTEIAARSNWMKARIALDLALGNLLEKNNIVLDDAINGSLQK